MTKEQALEKLIDQINSDMATFIGILAVVLAAFLYFQRSLKLRKNWKLESNLMKN